MRKSMALMAAVAGLLIAGCSGSSSSSSSGSSSGGSTGTGTTTGGSGGSSSGGSSGTSGSGCTITLTGAVTQTLSCATPTATYSTSDDQAAFALNSSSNTGGVTDAIFGFGVNGELMQTTYDFNSSTLNNMSGTYAAQSASGKTWSADSNGPTGTMSVNITSLSQTNNTATGHTYVVHGTIDATLAAQGSATGTITAHVDF